MNFMSELTVFNGQWLTHKHACMLRLRVLRNACGIAHKRGEKQKAPFVRGPKHARRSMQKQYAQQRQPCQSARTSAVLRNERGGHVPSSNKCRRAGNPFERRGIGKKKKVFVCKYKPTPLGCGSDTSTASCKGRHRPRRAASSPTHACRCE